MPGNFFPSCMANDKTSVEASTSLHVKFIFRISFFPTTLTEIDFESILIFFAKRLSVSRQRFCRISDGEMDFGKKEMCITSVSQTPVFVLLLVLELMFEFVFVLVFELVLVFTFVFVFVFALVLELMTDVIGNNSKLPVIIAKVDL